MTCQIQSSSTSFVFIVIAVGIDVSRICLCQFLKLLRSVLGMFFQLKLRGRFNTQANTISFIMPSVYSVSSL